MWKEARNEFSFLASIIAWSIFLSYLPGLNRRPPPYQGDALPTELKQHFWVKKKNSASRTRTYDIMINSHALLPTELWRKINKAWQRPTLAGRNPQLLSALRSLTSVFEMGTGVSFLPSSPHFISEKTFVLSILNLYPTPSIYQLYNSWLSPRPISTSPLHASRHFHF